MRLSVEQAEFVCRVESVVPCFGEPQDRLNRFDVAHLTDQHDIGVFPKRHPNGRLERTRVGADLAVSDKALVVVVDKLHGILDGQNVPRLPSVDALQHGGKRGRFARATGSGNQNQTVRALTQLFRCSRDAHLAQCADSPRDQTKDGSRNSH